METDRSTPERGELLDLAPDPHPGAPQTTLEPSRKSLAATISSTSAHDPDAASGSAGEQPTTAAAIVETHPRRADL